MQIVCLVLSICSVTNFYKRVWDSTLGFLLMDCVSCFKFFSKNFDFGCGFLVFGWFRQLFNFLGLFLLFRLGLKVLQLGFHSKSLIQFLFDYRGKSRNLRHWFCSKSCFDGICGSRVSPRGLLEYLKNPEPTMIGQLEQTKEHPIENGDAKENVFSNEEFGEIGKGNGNPKETFVPNGEFDEIGDGDGNLKETFVSDGEYGDDTSELEFVDEDDEFDVMALRKLVRISRQRANAACLELEKERIAAATAAEEAMAMILRLQNEKSLVEMEASQFRRLAEQKQIHDQEVIQSLRWIVMKHESERSLLEDQLRFYRQKLRICVKDDDGDESEGIEQSLRFFNPDIEDSPGDAEGDESEGIEQSLRFFNPDIEDSPGDALISSLDIDTSPTWYAQVHS